MNDRNTVIIILAAGASTRFGSPKQLAKIGDKTLLERTCNTAVSTGLKTVVVLGANAEEIIDGCDLKEADVVINKDWGHGMSSSIRAGIGKALEIDPETEAVLLVPGDQPFVIKETLLKLIAGQNESGTAIVASEYADTIGTPALFIKEVFEQLLSLKGDRGAKVLIEKYRQVNLSVVPAPEAEFDIDTEADLQRSTRST